MEEIAHLRKCKLLHKCAIYCAEYILDVLLLLYAPHVCISQTSSFLNPSLPLHLQTPILNLKGLVGPREDRHNMGEKLQ
jgi:hypothetical protein